jgi:hypothetical protein
LVGDDHAQVSDFCSFEFALFDVEMEAGLLEGVQHSSDMNTVFFKRVAINEYVVDISRAEDVKERVEDFVNPGLESGWGVGQAKGHNKGLEKAVSRIKSSKPFVAVCHPYLIKSGDDI